MASAFRAFRRSRRTTGNQGHQYPRQGRRPSRCMSNHSLQYPRGSSDCTSRTRRPFRTSNHSHQQCRGPSRRVRPLDSRFGPFASRHRRKRPVHLCSHCSPGQSVKGSTRTRCCLSRLQCYSGCTRFLLNRELDRTLRLPCRSLGSKTSTLCKYPRPRRTTARRPQ